MVPCWFNRFFISIGVLVYIEMVPFTSIHPKYLHYVVLNKYYRCLQNLGTGVVALQSSL